MNLNCEHQCGWGPGWSDMVNVSEPLFEFSLDSELPKMLTGSNQNGKGSQCDFITWVIRRYCSLGIQKAPKSLAKVLMCNMSMS